ncbi:MAG: TIR domain-containing protein [Thermomicrobiales bacterium]
MSDSSEDAAANARSTIRLAYPRSLAVNTVRDDLEHAKKLFRTMPVATNFHPDDFNEWKQQFGFWDNRVVSFLERAFTNDAMKRRYEGPLDLGDEELFALPGSPTDVIEALKQKLMQRMRCLSDILNELPTIPEDVDVIRAWEQMHEEREQQEGTASQPKTAIQSDHAVVSGREDVFIVHGHDEGAKHAVKRFCDAVLTEGEGKILDEQPNSGRTLIEKFEQESATARYAIVLFTPDDLGAAKADANNPQERARQNVIFELGYFVGKLGRVMSPDVCK